MLNLQMIAQLPREELQGVSEDDFKAAVLDCAQGWGWLRYHTLPAWTAGGGWRTATQGNVGFPDLVLARGGLVILAELKREQGRTSLAQNLWLAALGEHGRLWRPRDAREIMEVMR